LIFWVFCANVMVFSLHQTGYRASPGRQALGGGIFFRDYALDKAGFPLYTEDSRN